MVCYQILKKGAEILSLGKKVVSSEFPQWQMKSRDGKNIVMTFKNGQNIVISTEKNDGSYDSELFEFNSVKDNVVLPDSPDFPEYLSELSLDLFDGVANSDARDDYNNNLKHTQGTVNGLVKYAIGQKNYFSKLKDTFSDFKGFVLKLINISVAEYIHDHIETKYYTKKEIDDMLQQRDQRITNIQGRLPNPTSIGTYHNPSRTDKMPSNIDVNDRVTTDAENIIDDWENN